MIDRQKLETVLSRRFPGATTDQIAAAANAIMGLGDEWEEISTEQAFGFHYAVQCTDICVLAREAEAGTEFRLLRRRAAPDLPERSARDSSFRPRAVEAAASPARGACEPARPSGGRVPPTLEKVARASDAGGGPHAIRR